MEIFYEFIYLSVVVCLCFACLWVCLVVLVEFVGLFSRVLVEFVGPVCWFVCSHLRVYSDVDAYCLCLCFFSVCVLFSCV